jgi:hypothetical protein
MALNTLKMYYGKGGKKKMNEQKEQTKGIGTAELIELSGVKRGQIDYLLNYGFFPRELVIFRPGKGRERIFSPDAVQWCKNWLSGKK